MEAGNFAINDFLKTSFAHSNHQRAGMPGRLRFPAGTEKIDNLVVKILAAPVPALGAGELFDAAAQAVEAKNMGRLLQLAFQLLAQMGKEKQFKPFALAAWLARSFKLDSNTCSHGNLGRRRRRLVIGIDAQTEAAQHLFQGEREFADGYGLRACNSCLK